MDSGVDRLQPTVFLAFCALQTTRVKSEKSEAQAGPRARTPEAEQPPCRAGGEPQGLWGDDLGSAPTWFQGGSRDAREGGREGGLVLPVAKHLCPCPPCRNEVRWLPWVALILLRLFFNPLSNP